MILTGHRPIPQCPMLLHQHLMSGLTRGAALFAQVGGAGVVL